MLSKLRQDMVNQIYSMPELLWKYYRIRVDSSCWTFHCPFPSHPGNDTRKSAKCFEDSNKVFCFTEQRIYTPYDVLRINGVSDKKLLKAISPKISELSALDTHKVKLPSDEYMEKASKMFMKRGRSVSILRKPLITYLRHCKKVLDKEFLD